MVSTVGDRVRIWAAFALPLLLVAVAGWFAWFDTWTRAEGELARTADSSAEYSKRIFHAATLAGRLTDSLLGDATDEEIRAEERRYHALLAQIMPELPVSNTITVSDRNGDLILMSNVYPVPEVSVADREWVQALKSDPSAALHLGSLAYGRVQGRPFFSVSVPRNAPVRAEDYNGLINVSLDPFAVARGLASTTHEPADVLSIIRSDGRILASTGTNWIDAPQVPETSPLRTAMVAGSARGMYEGRAIGLRNELPLGRGLLIAYRQVGDLPVYVTVSRPNRAIAAPWIETMARLLVVGIPASLALGLLSLAEARRRSDLNDSEAELQAAFENATTGNALVEGANREILKANTCLCEITGRERHDLIGMSLDDLLAPSEVTGKGADGETGGARPLTRPDGSHRWVELGSARVSRANREAPELEIVTIHDVTERKEAEERQLLLSREVDHRAKNVLAIVQAVIRLVRDPAARHAMKDVEGRIQALARAHDLMSNDRWEGAGLRALLEDELSAYRGGAQIAIEGPDTKIKPSAVQPLSMALHELATNAVKHGALASESGHLHVSWSETEESGRWTIQWQETSGRLDGSTTVSGGSGMAILRGSVDQLGGSIQWDRSNRGVVCTIDLPSDCLAGSFRNGVRKEPSAPDVNEAAASVSLKHLRVLLVEDELVVAMDTSEILRRLGCEVVGPVHRIEEAEHLLEEETGCIDVAMLDVNLHGTSSIGLARDLANRGVPCVFVTGYASIAETDGHDSWVKVAKPFKESDIEDALRRVISRRPAMKRAGHVRTV
jgi:PAS domain S-box-containing protein